MSPVSQTRRARTLQRLQEDYERTLAQIAQVGYVMKGSVVRRTKRCGQPGCRCHRGPDYEHGPYYQWTRKIRAKTLTTVLAPTEARHYRQWIANGRSLRRLVARLYKTSERAARYLVQEESSE